MAEVMSLIWTIFMIVPVVAPFVGQVILLTGPWQLIFVFMGVVGFLCAAWALIRLPETLAVADRRSLSFASVAEGFGIVVRTRPSLFYGLAGMFMFGGVLGFVNSSQQIYVDHYGMGAYFPFLFAVLPVSFAAAFFLNSRLVERFGMRRLAHSGMLVFLGVTGLWLVLSLTTDLPLWLFVVMLALAALCQGVAWGNVGSLMMAPLGEVAGTASAVFGALSTVGAAVLGYIVAQFFNGTPTPVIAAFFVCGLCVVGCFLIAENGRLFGTSKAAPEPAMPHLG
jgi:DHA1 family bicyclomycin/chloramphenicol resistance-like MFS transporter